MVPLKRLRTLPLLWYMQVELKKNCEELQKKSYIHDEYKDSCSYKKKFGLIY